MKGQQFINENNGTQKFELEFDMYEMMIIQAALNAYQQTARFDRMEDDYKTAVETLDAQLTCVCMDKPTVISKVYFETLAGAIDAAMFAAKEKGFEVDQYPLTSGIHIGETERKTLSLYIKGIVQRKCLHIQIYRMDSGRYELNFYIA